MSIPTFDVIVDYATLVGAAVTEVSGSVEFVPIFNRKYHWLSDGEKIIVPKPWGQQIHSENGAQTFRLAHPSGWSSDFYWAVTAVVSGDNLFSKSPLLTPAVGTSTPLPELLNNPISASPGTTLKMMTIHPSVSEGDVLVLSASGVTGIPRDQVGSGGGGSGQLASFTQAGNLQAVFVLPGGTIPVGTPPWTLVVEVG